MDKQINLYRNVRAGAERRRQVVFILAAAALVLAVVAFGLNEKMKSDKTAFGNQLAQTEQAIEREKALIESLGSELKRLQVASVRTAQTGLAQDLRLLSRRDGNELAGLSTALTQWSVQGAALRSLAYEKGVLTLGGEARDAESARQAARQLNTLLANGVAWEPAAREIREPKNGGGLMEFKVTGRLLEGSK